MTAPGGGFDTDAWPGWVRALELVPRADGFRGRCLAGRGTRIFGGHLVAHTLLVAQRHASSQHLEPLSVHTHFLEAGDALTPVDYSAVLLRTGRSFEHWQVDACQTAGRLARSIVLLHRPESGPEHTLRELRTDDVRVEPAPPLLVPGANPLVLAGFDVIGAGRPDGTDARLPGRRVRLRVRGELPADPATSAALVAWSSELVVAGTPDLELREFTRSRTAASLDHDIRFHVGCDPRLWWTWQVVGSRMARGRAFVEGSLFVDGALAASVGQELLMRLEMS